MPRIPLVSKDVSFADAEDNHIVDAIKARRGVNGLAELDRALLHAPKIASGWSAFFGAVRGKTSLPDSVRECAIARVAVLTHIEYEWNAHARLLLKSSDVEIGQEAVEFIGKSAPGSIKVGSSGPGGLESKHIAVLALADANTEQVKVPQEVFDAVKNFFSDKEVVELVATIAAYNCVVRFMSALEIGQ